MNIFKILANGDGTINEANISAFFGYLLDPYQDHGLGFEFLERFLGEIDSLNEETIFQTRKYDYEVLLEQALRDEANNLKKKENVDIIILCFEPRDGQYKELIAKDKAANPLKIRSIFLIENKINKSAKSINQLRNQFENTITTFEIDKEKIFSIYITPAENIFRNEFGLFNKNMNNLSSHFLWSTKNGDGLIDANIYKIIKELLKDESEGNTEAINEYTRHTLISFLKFIENDFKSQLVEKHDNYKGKYKKDLFDNLLDFLDKYRYLLSKESLRNIEEFYTLVSMNNQFVFRHSKTHPISIFYNSKKIFGITRNGKSVVYHFMHNKNENIKLKLSNYLKSISIFDFYEGEEKKAITIKDNIEIVLLYEIFLYFVDLNN